ncbi:hypothetical protein FJ208_00230 [Candidatus Gribaldobacteria bacterium]|nr:hypothetical protein [Candidatus Gribaldobacteria bacterium]
MKIKITLAILFPLCLLSVGYYFLQISQLDSLSWQIKQQGLIRQSFFDNQGAENGLSEMTSFDFIKTEKIVYLPLKIERLAKGD